LVGDTERPDAICGVVCAGGPNGEPLACGYENGHEGVHSWASLPTWTDRWRIVHHPHRDAKKQSIAIEGPPTDSRIVYGVAMDRGVPVHERVRDTERPAGDIADDLKRLADIGDQVLAGTPIEQFELGEFEIRFVVGYCSTAAAKTHEYALPDHPALSGINRPDDERYLRALREVGRSIHLCQPIEHTMRIIDDALRDTEQEHKPSTSFDEAVEHMERSVPERARQAVERLNAKREPE
jgi:hypothetical protein